MQLKSDKARSLLCCPGCHEELTWGADKAECGKCSRAFPVENGVVRFRDEIDEFYEGTYLRQMHFSESSADGLAGKLRRWAFFNLAQSGVVGEIRRVLPNGGTVVDLGCAGGIAWLGERGVALGVELSLSGLELAAQVYAATLQADVVELPIIDKSIDVVYSSYLWEHLDDNTKVKMLRESRRVLKPGGSLVLQCDSLSNNAIARYALHDPARYKVGFIDNDGHIGLEPGSVTLDRLRSAGFEIRRVLKLNTTILQYPSTFGWLDLAYGDSVRWVRSLGRAAKWMVSSKAGLPIELGVTAFDRAINPVTKVDAAARIIVTATCS